MENKQELVAEEREVLGKKVRRLRAQGLVPAVMYGGHGPSVSLQVDRMALRQLLRHGGRTGLFQLKVGKAESVPVLIKQMHVEPDTGDVLHVDFYRVAEREKLKAKVPLRFVGEAPVAETHDVVIGKPLDEVTVECYPSDLPKSVEVDLSLLTDTHSTIRVGDLQTRERVSIVEQPDVVVASVSVTARELEPEEVAPAAPEAVPEEAAEAGEGTERAA